ncbi:MAG: DUF1571 domain-containing protein [Chlamydiota bacterium]
MRRLLMVTAAVLGGLVWGGGRAFTEQGKSADLLEMLAAARAHYVSVHDYTTTFHKQQRVGGVLQPEEKMLFKFKKPFSVYLKWTGEMHNGREALFVRGKYGNKLLVHLGGMVNYFAPTVSLHPAGWRAMGNNLRPITESGMESTVALITGVCEQAKKNGDLKVRYCGEGQVAGRPTRKFERLLPAGKGYPAHLTLFELDRETGYPLSIISYGWEGEVLEKYRYEEFRTNVGLTDKDFDRGNQGYGFGYFTVPL